MKIQLKYAATQAQWEASTVVLATGEPGVAIDTGAIRIGNGADVWSALPQSNQGVVSINGEVGEITLTKAMVGLDQVDNTPDIAKPVSGATQAALSALSDRIDALEARVEALGG